MKKKAVKRVLLSLIVMVTTQVVSAQKVFTKYGDKLGTLDGIIKAYYDVLTVSKGAKINFERDSILHIPGVRVASAGLDPDGVPYCITKR